jgi:hypothetical protein
MGIAESDNFMLKNAADACAGIADRSIQRWLSD